MSPAGFEVVENAQKPGEVTFTWMPVTQDVNFQPLNTDHLTYTIARKVGSEYKIVGENLTECTFTYVALADPSKPEFGVWAIQAETPSGKSYTEASVMLALGNPYPLPFLESFSNATTSHITSTSNAGAYWKLVTDEEFEAASAADFDNGFAACYGESVDAQSTMLTGKIALPANRHISLKFQAFNVEADFPDTNLLTLMLNSGSGWIDFKEYVINQHFPAIGQWNPMTVDLSAFAGKTVQLGFRATCKSNRWSLLDNIMLTADIDDNLAVTSLLGPDQAEPGRSFALTAAVANLGVNAAPEFNATLYKNGQIAETRKFEGPVEPGQTVAVVFPQTLEVVDAPEAVYKVTVDYEPDGDLADNSSAELTVAVRSTEYPTVTDLTAYHDADGNILVSWHEPDFTALRNDRITESFEEFEPFTEKAQHGWSFVDGDGANVFGFEECQIPNITYERPHTWIVLDGSDASIERFGFGARTGRNSLGSLSGYVESGGNMLYKETADWAISPELSGQAQTIELYARAYSGDYAADEAFEVRYSTSGNTPDDFTQLAGQKKGLSTSWTKFTFELPAGARYMAVKATANGAFMTMVDDISYNPADSYVLNLQGYNVFVDGVKSNSQPVGSNFFKHPASGERADHVIAVSALYDRGESPAVTFMLDASGIVTVLAPDASAPVEYYNLQGQRLSNPAPGQVVIRRQGSTATKVRF